jgi:DNA-binding NarL/FixJ family response regulator
MEVGELMVSGSETQTTGSPGPIQIVIADDHHLFREALGQLLSGCPDLEVVGEASNGQEALSLCRSLRPKLALVDVQMPEMSGIEAACEIKRELPSTIVLMLTAFENPDYLMEALKAGAAGYVLKHASFQQIVESIRRVLDGDSPLSQELAMRLLLRLIKEREAKESLSTLASSDRPLLVPLNLPPLAKLLTPREEQVLRLMTQGQTNKQIAQSLFISVSTVKNHVHRIISKLGASDRTQAVITAIGLGFVALGMWLS